MAWYRQARAQREAAGEDGFTLPELLIACVIMPIIVGAIAFAFIEILDQNNTVAKSLSDTADAQVLSSNFVQDVASAQEITTDEVSLASPGAGAPALCGSTGTSLLSVEWGGYISSNVELYRTVVTYAVVANPNPSSGMGFDGGAYFLVRNYCGSGPSSTPTGSSTVSSDLPWPVTNPSCTTSSLQVCVKATSGYSSLPANAASGWASVVGATGVSISVTEPGSSYSLSLDGNPASGIPGTTSTVSSSSPSCGQATPGTAGQELCFVDFSSFVWSDTTTNAQGKSICQQINEAISGTPFTLSFCVHSTISGQYANQYSQLDQLVGPVSVPTYYDASGPNQSEAYLGNNGFYSGIPGKPALYQCPPGITTANQSVGVNSTGNLIPAGCPTTPNSLEDSDTLAFTNIQVTGPGGTLASGWQLVTGDAESTDTNESIAWTTCPALTSSGSSPVAYTGVTASGGTCSVSNAYPALNILPDSVAANGTITNLYGNACNYQNYNGGGLNAVYLQTPGTNSVECAENVQSNKTGTVMLEAQGPTDLTVNMEGIEAIFVAVLL